MAVDNTILVRRGSGTPDYTDFTQYELAYDYTNDILYIRDGNAMVEVGGGGGTVDTSGSPVDNDYAKFTDANTIEGMSIAEMKLDLNLGQLADLDAISANKVTSGTFADARIASSSITQHTDPKYLRSNANDTASGDLTLTGALTTTSTINIGGAATFQSHINMGDSDQLKLGSDADMKIQHTGNHGYITNDTGHLYIRSGADDKQINIQADDGSGGMTDYMRFSGSESLIRIYKNTRLLDSVNLQIGSGNDLQLKHDGSNSYIQNRLVGKLIISNQVDDTDIDIKVKDGGSSITALTIDASNVGRVILPNDNQHLAIGAGQDLRLYHSGTDSYLQNNTGTYRIDQTAAAMMMIRNTSSDQDFYISVNDGGSQINALQIDASEAGSVFMPNDNATLGIGAGNDLRLFHDGTNSYIYNYQGELRIGNTVDDSDTVFYGDDGSGGNTPYLKLDGSVVRTVFDKPATFNDDIYFPDSAVAYFGTNNDLRLQHNGSHSYIQQYGTGDLYIDNTIDDKSIIFRTDDGTGGVTPYLKLDGNAGNLNFYNKALVAIGGIYGNSNTLNMYANTYYFKNSSGGVLGSLSGSTLDIPNTGDWSFIKNNTNSGGLRFGTKDGSGNYANQIEISNAGNYVKLNENTTVTGKVQASGKLKTTMTGGFTIGDVAGEDRIQNSSNSFSFLTDGNAYANMQFATVTAGTWNGTAVAAAYVGNLPASKITSGTFDINRLPTKDENNMSSDSDQHVPTQQSVKAYVDANAGGSNTSSDGSAGTPAFNFTSDTNTGMFRVGSDTLGFSAGGNTKLQINSDGRINYNGWTGVDHITVRSQGHTNSGSSSTFYIKFCTVVVDNSPANYNGLSLSGKLYRGDNGHGNWIDWSVWFNAPLDSGSIAHGGFMRSNGAHWISNIFVQRTAGDGEIDNGSCTYELYYDLNENWTNNIYNVATEVHYPSEGKFNVTWNHDQSEVTSLPGTEVINMQTNYYDDGNQTLVQTGAVGAPSYSFLAQRNTGMYGFTDNTIGFSCNGTRMLSIKADGSLELRNDGSSQGASIQRVGQIQFTWDRDSYGTSNNHAIVCDSDNLIINSFDDVTINLDSNNNDGSETFDVRKHATSLTGGTLLYQVDGAGLCSSYGGYGTINGSASSPSFRFNNDADTGIYRKAANQIGFTTGGEEQMYLTDGALQITQPVRIGFANDQRIFDDGGGGLKVGAQSHKLTLYAGSTDGTIQFQDGGRNGTVRATISGGGVYKWGAAADYGTLTWDTGKAILTSQSGKILELRNKNSTDMISLEDNSLKFIADGTERFAANQNGLDLGASSANKIVHNDTSTRDKYRVWNSSLYAIGMESAITFGGLNDYGMTFQFNNEDDRGFWWGDSSHSKAQGAMALTTNGKLTVAHSMRLGYGESDTTTPGSTFAMDLYGANGLQINTTGDQQLKFVRSGGNDISIEHDTSQMYFYNRATSKVMFLMSNSGSAIMGYNSNPSLEIRNTATSAGSGGSLVFGHSQSGTNSVGRISSYLTDGSQSNRSGHLRFWTRHAGTESLAMQLQSNNYLKLYQHGDTSDYLELYVDDTRAYYHHAHTGSSSAYHRFITDNGYIEIGPANSGWGHINTDRGKFYFNNKIIVDGGIVGSYDEDLSLRRNFSSSDGINDRIDILDDSQKFYVGNTEEFRVDGSGSRTLGISRADDYFQKNASGSTGCLLKMVNSGWSNATTHDIIYNHYRTNLGDYTYLKSAGNSANDHGIIVVADQYIFMGKDNLTTGSLDDSATAPITDVYMRVDSSGNGLFDGDVVAFSTTIASDARLKENVKDLNYGLKDVLDIRPVSFDWKEKRNGQHDIGVIAQEIEKIIPEVVVEVDTLNSEDTHKTVDYAKLTSVLIKAVQEQQQQINELKEKLNG